MKLYDDLTPHEELVQFLRWYCNSDFVTSEVDGFWVNYKYVETEFSAEEIIDIYEARRKNGNSDNTKKQKWVG